MGKTVKERLIEIKKDREIAYVNFFNNGEVTTDNNWYAKQINTLNNGQSIAAVKEIFCRAAESYLYDGDYDSIEMDIPMALIFRREDVDDNNQIKANAKPINGIVRFYTGSARSYLAEKQTNKADYYTYGGGYHGYLDYNQFVAAMVQEGIELIGPQSFDEFQTAMMAGEKCDVTIASDFIEKSIEKSNVKSFSLR